MSPIYDLVKDLDTYDAPDLLDLLGLAGLGRYWRFDPRRS